MKTIFGFWAIYCVTIVARAFLGSDPATVLANKVLTVSFGIVLTFILYAAIATLSRGQSMRRRAVVAGIGSLVASAALAGSRVKLVWRPEHNFRLSPAPVPASSGG